MIRQPNPFYLAILREIHAHQEAERVRLTIPLTRDQLYEFEARLVLDESYAPSPQACMRLYRLPSPRT